MSDKYVVEREYNYTIAITDRKGKSLHFRDITGKDLEFLERYLGEEQKDISFGDCVGLLIAS